MDSTESPPEYMRLSEAVKRKIFSRSIYYRLAGEGHIRLVKAGNATILDLVSERAYLASLREADIRPAKKPKVS